MKRGEVWGIDESLFMPDFLDAFRALGFATRRVPREEADQAGMNGPPPAFVLDIKMGGRTRKVLSDRGIAYVAVSLDQWYNAPRLVAARRQPPFPGNYVFTCAPEQVPVFQALGFSHAEYLPFGVDTDRFRPLDLTEPDRRTHASRVCFVGTSLLNNPIDGYKRLKNDLAARAARASPEEAEACRRTQNLLDDLVALQTETLFEYRIPQLIQDLEYKHKVTFMSEGMTPAKETWAILLGVHMSMRQRLAVVERLAPLGIAVYGSQDWGTLSIPGLEYRGEADHRSLLPTVINAAEVSVNVSKIMFDTAVGPRVFETLACGGFLLTNRNTALSTMFVDGKDLVVYNSLDDLYDKARYYLEHPAERRAIAERGCRKVRARDALLLRARRIVEVLEEDGVVPSAARH